ncbi:MRP-S28 domain-containing protein [Aphelenchoides fujianensis]|nr:MRP-S28 domain-containing protein [Aphelenchoides fujianensis]
MSGRRVVNATANLVGNQLKRQTAAAQPADSTKNAGSKPTAAQPEPFRELFIQPKRKLGAQLMIERLTGRAEALERYKPDVGDRMTVRRARREEMPEDQDWPSVWPAAQSFRASGRPAARADGSPTSSTLTPEHIRRHCEAIKKFCTPFPPELKENPKLIQEHLPVRYTYSDFVHQGTSIRDIRSRVVTVSVQVPRLGLDEHGEDKLKKLVGNRYEEEGDLLRIVSDRCYTRKQNRDYSEYLLVVLYHESNKVEAWEKDAQIYRPKQAETVESARRYGDEIRARLGIPRVTEDVPNQVEIAH